ncbi:MAG: chemotaxis protein CheA [Thermodesulfovibrionales bacterium]|nr:chemotaxis protein CheA [Thermodesulfovibrionales bacterium]
MKGSEKEFIAEAEDILEESGRLLLEVQDTYKTGTNPDTVNALFRSLHTLKGLAGLFGYAAVTDISHALESLLDDIRLGKVDITEDIIQFLFKSIDTLRDIIAAVKEGGEPEVTAYLNDIESFRKSIARSAGLESLKGIFDEAMLKVLSDYEEHRLKANIKEGRGIYQVKTVFGLSDFDKSLENVSKSIKSIGELISTLPTSRNLPPDSIGFILLFGSLKPPAEIKKTINYDVSELLGPRVEASKPQEIKETSIKTTSTTVRVDIEKLDRILNTIGELTLAKGAVTRISAEMAENYGHNPFVIDMHKISQTLDRRLAELQDQVLEIRMVPIGQIFGRLSQVIRRYSKDVGKQIELAMYGEDTELDKYLAEEIIDPLVHIVRNAIDHGIEPPEVRKRKGKKEVASVYLKAFQKGNHVVIEVRDDGAGIDIEKIRQKAIEKGLIEKGMELQRREMIELIFMPGFSTKEVVSEVSGRGVGLDIVRDKLSALGGFADVETVKDAGTTFILTLPITLAIIKSLTVRVGGEKFAIPLTTISETLVIEHRNFQTIEGREVYNLRGVMLPMARLKTLFDIGADASERSFAVVVGFGERSIGLLVDELLGQHEIVIKSLGDYFKGLKGFAGAAEIGKHEVILVIDVESAIEESLKQKGLVHV